MVDRAYSQGRWLWSGGGKLPTWAAFAATVEGKTGPVQCKTAAEDVVWRELISDLHTKRLLR